MKNNFIIFGS